MTTQTATVPDIGELSEVELTEILVRRGDRVEVDDSLVVLESEKASIEVPSLCAGKVLNVLVRVGDKLGEGAPLIEILTDESGQPDVPSIPATSDSEDQDKLERREQRRETVDGAVRISALERRQQRRLGSALQSRGETYAGPGVRAMAREIGLELGEVQGSGAAGRITRDDVRAHVRARLAGSSALAQFVIFDRADVTGLYQFCNSLGPELTESEVALMPLPFVLKAVACALGQLPLAGAGVAGEEARDGHVARFVIRCVSGRHEVDFPLAQTQLANQSVLEILGDLTGPARQCERAEPDQEKESAPQLSVISLGADGGVGFTPVLNVQDIAVLGVSGVSTEPVWNGCEFVPRKVLPLSLCFDYQRLAASDAGSLLRRIGELLADIRRMAL